MTRGAVVVSMQTAVSSEGEVRDTVSDRLVAFVADAGFIPVAAPNRPLVALRLLESSVGLVLSGGAESVDDDESTVGNRRRTTERELLRIAFARELPVLGVCRGMQVINAHLGGDLQRITPSRGHIGTEHHVTVSGNRVAALLRSPGSLRVNSFHQDGIARLGKELKIAAVSPDGQIEAVEHRALPVVGLMWHPERSCSDTRFARVHADVLGRLLAVGGAAR